MWTKFVIRKCVFNFLQIFALDACVFSHVWQTSSSSQWSQSNIILFTHSHKTYALLWRRDDVIGVQFSDYIYVRRKKKFLSTLLKWWKWRDKIEQGKIYKIKQQFSKNERIRRAGRINTKESKESKKMTNLKIDHISCWMLFKLDGLMCCACRRHLWNYKNIGHLFHHIDLWIACCYDPDSNSSVRSISKLPNYVFEQTLSIFSLLHSSIYRQRKKQSKWIFWGFFFFSLSINLWNMFLFFSL